MGCGCGGSNSEAVQRLREQRLQAAQVRPLTGPNAPGYTWDGPEGASVTAAVKPVEAPTK